MSIRLLCCLSTVALLSPIPAQQDLAEQMRSYLARCQHNGFSGIVLVARGGEIVLQHGCGYADREAGKAFDEHTLFEIASTTKPFTAAAILKLEEQGKLSTDDPIAKHLPGVPEQYADITIYHLLTHTSGMPRMGPSGGGDDLEQAVATYLSGSRPSAPGDKHEYWNGGYALLAGIIERASGMSYAEYCREHVLLPAGMQRSGFTGDAHLDRSSMATGYDGDTAVRKAGEHAYGSYGYQYRGMGGLVTSLADLHRWDRALRTDDVLQSATREKMFTAFRGSYGCGWYVLDEPRHEQSHGGDVRGFHTQFSRYPEADACVIVLCNADGIAPWAIADTLECMLFGTRSRYPLPPLPEPLPDATVASLPGTYDTPDGGHIVVRLEGDRVLLGARGRQAIELLEPFERMSRGRVDHGAATIRAKQLVVALDRGELAPLRDILMDGIPVSWVDKLGSELWPAHLEKWGPLTTTRSLGAKAWRNGGSDIYLELEHERGRAHVRIAFTGDELNILDLDGPEFPIAVHYTPVAGGLDGFRWMGPHAPKVRLVTDEAGRVQAIEFAVRPPVRCER